MKIRVPASSANLGPGFDCLAIALDLWLEVLVDFSYQGVKVTTIGEGEEYLRTDSRNYFIRMINLILKGWSKPPVKNIHIKVKNQIPLSRGLGSSAAVTVASLKIAAELENKRISADKSIDVIANLEGHADNGAAAYYGGLILTGFKDKGSYKAVQIPLAKKLPLALIAIPDYKVRTRDARRVLSNEISLYDFVYNNSRTALTVHAWTTGNYKLLNNAMEDRVHQHYRMSLIPGGVEMLKKASNTEGVYGSALSGSGSTIIAFGEQEGLESLSYTWQKIWKKRYIKGKMKILKISRSGVTIN